MRPGLGRLIACGVLIGGLTAGLAGGLWAATDCYLGRLDPDIYPNRSLFTLGFIFVLSFIFAAVPGIVLGIVGSLVAFYLPRRKLPAPISVDTPTQDTWPPAPMITKGDGNDNNP